MNRGYILALTFLLFIVTSHAVDLQSRIWTNQADGRTIEASLIGVEGMNVILKRADNLDIKLSPDLLIESDVNYIFEHLDRIKPAIDLSERRVETTIVWKDKDSRQRTDRYTFYHNEDEGCLISDDEKWIFVYSEKRGEDLSYNPPYSFDNGRRDPLKSTLTTSRHLAKGQKNEYRENAEKALQELLVESKLSSMQGLLCQYYRYQDPRATLEVWSIPDSSQKYGKTLARAIGEMMEKPGYDMFAENGTHRLYEQQGFQAHNKPMRAQTVAFLTKRYISLQETFPLAVKLTHTHAAKRNEDIIELDLMLTTQTTLSSQSIADKYIQDNIEKILRNGTAESVVGKPGSGWN